MRRFFVLVRTAALEALCEPLLSVLFLSALLAVPLFTVFHCHQFGDPARLPRECGLSLLLVFGLVFATSSAVRVIGGELNKGTASAVLARAVPRSLFFCAKATGVLVAFALFAAAVTLATLVSAATAETGSRLMSHHGGSSVWGFGVAMSTGLTLLVYAAAACANAAWGMRFCLTSCCALSVTQGIIAAIVLPFAAVPPAFHLVGAFAVLTVGCCALIAFAGALAVRLKPAAVTACTVSVVLLSFLRPVTAFMPNLHRFWLADAYTAAGQMPSAETIVTTLGAGVLLTVFWLTVGSVLLERRELP
jgi:hypothetical protein